MGQGPSTHGYLGKTHKFNRFNAPLGDKLTLPGLTFYLFILIKIKFDVAFYNWLKILPPTKFPKTDY